MRPVLLLAAFASVSLGLGVRSEAALVSSQFARCADTGGATDRYAGAGWRAIGFGDDVIEVTRPDGGDGFGQEQLLDLVPGFSEGEVDAWMQPRVSGEWTIGREDGSTETFDVSPLYRSAAARSYGVLTASSFALWTQIMADRTSGTFTFEMDQTVAELGCSAVQLQLFGSGVATIVSGRAFTVKVDGNAASEGGVLLLSGSGLRGSVAGSLGTEVFVEDGFVTIYTTTIPAPAGIAAFAALAFAGSRGRRHR